MSARPRHARSVANDATSHYVVVGDGPPLVLLHGFPQTWREWEGVIEHLVDEYTIIAPDLRGLGGVPGPASGYDIFALAEDVRAIVEREVGSGPITLCGHDMGSYVAFAYALTHRDGVSSLTLVDAPLPGTSLGDSLRTNPRTWHVAFHQNADVAHLLIAGREREYLEYFIRSRLINPDAVSGATMDSYVGAYTAPGALRAALEMYRSLPYSSELVRAELHERGKLTCPLVYVAGALTAIQDDVRAMVEEMSLGGDIRVVESSGHYVPEEQPEVLAGIIRDMHAKGLT
ncbi:alpha/beta hydrolase [Dactylosporangium sp. NPDC051484]|uniref:alpha/beta fold hydrolase n=1 Tax=Dactylosporangium sp. NPDC051484 TaxID=3154942 RepID=UPI00344F0504